MEKSKDQYLAIRIKISLMQEIMTRVLSTYYEILMR